MDILIVKVDVSCLIVLYCFEFTNVVLLSSRFLWTYNTYFLLLVLLLLLQGTPFVGEIMYTSLQSGISDVVLNNLISSYQKRCEILYNSIMYNKENNNNDIIQEQEQQQQQRQRIIEVVSKPTGGYFMWIKFVISSDNNNNDAKKKPITIIDSEEFLQYCIDRKKPIKFMPGTRCDPLFDDNVEELITTTEKTTEEELSQYGRLCFADLDVSDLKEGATKLILCFKEYISYINNNTN